MANHKAAIARVLGHEGGYALVDGDAGRETYCGISRRYHPHWEGWATIDMHKAQRKLEWKEKIADALLDDMVSTYYYKTFWVPIAGDKIRCQALAELLLDWTVNSGDDGVKALQGLVGTKQDGDMGPKTLAAVNGYPDEELAAKLKWKRILFVHELARKKPKNKKFMNGWLDRVNSF